MDKFELIDKFRDAIDRASQSVEALALPRWSPDNWYQLAALCEPCEVEAGEAVEFRQVIYP